MRHLLVEHTCVAYINACMLYSFCSSHGHRYRDALPVARNLNQYRQYFVERSLLGRWWRALYVPELLLNCQSTRCVSIDGESDQTRSEWLPLCTARCGRREVVSKMERSQDAIIAAITRKPARRLTADAVCICRDSGRAVSAVVLS